jgi:hypothetical protein
VDLVDVREEGAESGVAPAHHQLQDTPAQDGQAAPSPPAAHPHSIVAVRAFSSVVIKRLLKIFKKSVEVVFCWPDAHDIMDRCELY